MEDGLPPRGAWRKRALLLFLAAVTLRLGASYGWQFDGLYGQDAFAYFDQARAIVDNLPQGKLPPADFFWPNGFPFLIALLMLLVGPTPLAGQLAALLAGALLPPLAYLLGRDLFAAGDRPDLAEPAGLLAGLLIAVAGQPILSSVVIMADMPALAWASLAAWGTVRALGRPTSETGRGIGPTALWFLAAGAALGLAVISRWLYAAVAPALGLYGLLRLRSSRTPAWLPGLAVLAGLLVLAPQLWLSLHRPEGLAHSWLMGWSPAHFFQRRFENVDGLFIYSLPNAIFYAQPAGHPAYIFPLLGPAAGWATWQLVRARQWEPLALLLGWAGPVYLFLAGIPYQNFRFGLSPYVPLVILTAFGLADLLGKTKDGPTYNRAGGRRTDNSNVQTFNGQTRSLPLRQTTDERAASLCDRQLTTDNGQLATQNSKFKILLILLSLLATLAWAYPMLDSFLTAQQRSKVIAAQVEQFLPPEASLLTFGLTLTFQHYTRLPALELFYFDPASLEDLLQTTAPLYLLVDPGNINSQWRGRAPAINYGWLQEHAHLNEVRRFPPYVLYKVEPVTRPGGGP